MNSQVYFMFLLITMLNWGHVLPYAQFSTRLLGFLSRGSKAPPSIPSHQARRFYALKPGVLEMIDDMRTESKTLEASISNETTGKALDQVELVEKLKTMRTFIEAADSLSVIDNDMKVIEEDISSGQNKDIYSSARKVYQEFAECKELIEQQLNLLVDGPDDATTE